MKKILILISIIYLGISLPSFAEEDTGDTMEANSVENNNFDREQEVKKYRYRFSLDSNKQTAYTGADLSMSFIEAYRQIEDSINPPKSLIYNILMAIPRIMVTDYVGVFQHEVFGHGARAREFGWKITNYKVNFDGTGSTGYLLPLSSHYQQRVAMALGGIQATEVLSYKVKESFLDSRNINPVYGAAYINSAGDQLFYVLNTKYNGKSHDINNYIYNMNIMYGKNYITKSKIKQRTKISFLDPFLWFSAYALATGEDFEYPMLNIGEVGYLPGFRAIFTPYGIENELRNYVRTPKTPVQINLSQGKHKTGTSRKVEIIVDKLFSTDKIDFGVDLAVWKQPKLLVADVIKAPNKNGYMAEAKASIKLSDVSSAYGAIGYKTSGFMMGRPLKSSTMVRVGVGFDL